MKDFCYTLFEYFSRLILLLEQNQQETARKLAATQQLHQVSTALYQAKNYEAVLSVLRYRTVLGDQAHTLLLLFFEQPLTDSALQAGQRPATAETIAYWRADATLPVSGRYDFTNVPPADERLRPDQVVCLSQPAAFLNEQFSAPAAVWLPLMVEGNWFGLVVALYKQPLTLPPAKLTALLSIAQQVARVVQELNQTQILRQLYETTSQVNTAVTLDDLVRAVTLPAIKAQASSVTLLSFEMASDGVPEWATVIARWQRHPQPALPFGTRIPFERHSGLSQLILTSPEEPIFISQTATDPRLDEANRRVFEHSQVEAAILLPLTIAGRWVALLSINWSQPRLFTTYEKRFYKAIAGQAAVVIDNHLLFHQTRQRAGQLQKLADIESMLSQARDEMEIITALALSFHTSHDCLVRLNYIDTTPDGHQPVSMRTVASWREGVLWTEDPLLTTNQVSPIPAAHLLLQRTSAVLFVEDLLTDSRFEDLDDHSREQLGQGAMAMVPLQSGGHWQGTVIFSWPTPHQFTAEEKFILRRLLEPASAVVARRRAYLAVEQTRQENVRLLERTESSLKEVQRLATIVENHTDFIGVSDLQGQLLYINPAGLVMLGLPNEYDIISMTVDDIYPPDVTDRLMNNILPAALETGYWLSETTMLAANQRVIDVEQTITANYDRQRKPYSFNITLRDISARKEAEETLRQTVLENSQLVAAVNNAEIGITITDPKQPDNPIIFVNPAFEKITGYTADEARGRNCRFLQGPDTDREMVQRLRTAIEAEQSCAVELLNYRQDGTSFWNRLLVNPIFDELGQLINFIGVQTDITNRKQAEEIQRRLSAVIEATPDMVSVADVSGQLLYLNPAGYNLLGLEPAESIATKSLAELHPEWARHILLNEAIPTAKQAGFWSGELEISRSDGRAIPTLHVIIAQQDDEEQVAFLAAVIRDISQSKAAEAEQKRLLDEVEAAYRQYVRQEWEQFLSERSVLDQVSYENVTPASDESASSPLAGHQPANQPTGTTKADQHPLEAPIMLRGQLIGTLNLEDMLPDREWTPNEIALVEAVAEQLALTLENLRLFEETQQQAARERIIADMTQKIWASGELEQVMETAVSQLGTKLNASKVVIRLGTKEQLKK